MKKILLSLIISLSLISFSSIEASAKGFKVLSFGAKAGVNFSTVSGIPENIGSMNTNFTGGLTFEFRPIKLVGLSAEVLYTGSGYSYKNVPNESEQPKVKYNFIDIPVMARIYIAGGLSLNAGVQASFLFSPTLNFGDVRSQFDLNKAVFSIPVSLSYSFRFGLVVEARYTFGLTNLVPDESVNSTLGRLDAATIKSENLAITVGWRIFGI